MKRLKPLQTLAASAFAAAGMMAGSAQAAPLIYEPFDDPDPSLNGNATGLGLTGNWSGGWSVLAGSYSYGTLATQGNKAQINSGRTGNQADIGSTLSSTTLMDDGETLWFSVLILTQPVVSGNMDFGFSIGTNGLGGSNNIPMGDGGDGGQGLGLSVKNGQIRATSWDASDGTGAERLAGLPLANPADYGQVFLIVGEIIWGSGGGDDTINLYAPDTNLNLGSVVSTKTRNLNQTNFDRISFANKADNLPVGVDEIRFGAESSDVLIAVPEPTSLALMGLGGLLMLRRSSAQVARRRRD